MLAYGKFHEVALRSDGGVARDRAKTLLVLIHGLAQAKSSRPFFRMKHE
jgi:hypothetical protein